MSASRIRGESVPIPGFITGASAGVRLLDELVEADEVPTPDLLKIDVEGGEVLVHGGMGHVIERRPAAAIECASMPWLRGVLRLLTRLGCAHLEVTRGGDDVGPVAVLAAT